MNKSSSSRFSGSGFAIGLALGVALSAALGPALGLPMGLGLAVVFGFARPSQC